MHVLCYKPPAFQNQTFIRVIFLTHIPLTIIPATHTHFSNSLFNPRRGGGFEPPVHYYAYDSLANCWFKPLTHLSLLIGCRKVMQI